MTLSPNSEKKIIWRNIIFFAITTLGALIGCPIYLYHHGLSPFLILLTIFYTIVTGMGITVGYHRLYAHTTYKAHPLVRFFLLFFGAAAFEQSALAWSSQHRDHHRYVDTDMDPYSIKKGFFYAHIGWLIFWKHKKNYENSKDLQKDTLLMHQHRYYILWAVASGILLPIALGALSGEALGALLFAVCFRLTLVYHSTFCINSVCHMFGKSTYDIYATAKDHWFVALLTFGEGYHNFHHRFPTDYRNGVRWYHWDPSKWTIRLLSRIGLTWDLKRVSTFRILEARLAGEARRAQDFLISIEKSYGITKALEILHDQQAKVKTHLADWEQAARKYRDILQEKVASHSGDLKQSSIARVNEARACFHAAYQDWLRLIDRQPQQLQRTLLQNAMV